MFERHEANAGRLAEWEALYGGDEPPVRRGSWDYYCTGARREIGPFGVWALPPSDPRQLAAAVVEYRRVRLERAEHLFDELRDRLRHTAGPDPARLAELKRLAAEVRAAQSALDETVRGHAARLPGFVSPGLRQAQAAAEARQAEWLEQVAAVEV